MKSDIHPEYRYVVFRDVNNGKEFITRSCASARDTTEFEGQEYPLIVLDISSESHPFYTGTQRIMDTEGRVERFMRKYGFGGGDVADVPNDDDAPAGEAEAPAGEADAPAEEAEAPAEADAPAADEA